MIYDRRDMPTAPIDYNFFWYDQATSDRDIPMMTFTTNPLPTIFAPPSFVSSLHISTNTDTNQTKYETYDQSKDNTTPEMGDPMTDKTVAGMADKYGQTIIMEAGSVVKTPPYTAQNAAFKQLQVGKISSHPANANSGLDYHRNESRDSALMANTTATLTAPGHPDVIPPMNIFVRGVGEKTWGFGGPYNILSAVHTIGTNGYEMSLELLKTVSNSGNTALNTKLPPGHGTKPPTPNGNKDSTKKL